MPLVSVFREAPELTHRTHSRREEPLLPPAISVPQPRTPPFSLPPHHWADLQAAAPGRTWRPSSLGWHRLNFMARWNSPGRAAWPSSLGSRLLGAQSMLLRSSGTSVNRSSAEPSGRRYRGWAKSPWPPGATAAPSATSTAEHPLGAEPGDTGEPIPRAGGWSGLEKEHPTHLKTGWSQGPGAPQWR